MTKLDDADEAERLAGGVEEEEEGEEIGEEEEEKQPTKRKTYQRENYRESCWWKYLQRDNLSDLKSRDGKTFRNRFTVPFQLFNELLVLAKSWFPQRLVDAFGKEVSPIELKLLGTLRILGKGCSWDLLYELSGVSAEVHRRRTLAFIAKFASHRTIVKFDGFVQKVRSEKRYTNAEYELQIGPNKWIREKGVYLLVDGGYHKWRIMQCPIKHTAEMDEIRWSEFAESIRKDVECSFGILKKRFQLLKVGINWHKKTDIDNAVFSCVILHNMLHEFDGYDERWENELYNAHNDKEEQAMLDKIRRRIVRTAENKDDYSAVGRLFSNINNINFASSLDDGEIEHSDKFEDLRSKLVKHLTNQYLEGKLKWIQI